MCWITSKKLKFKIAKENIPIYKVCCKEGDKIISPIHSFEYRLGWLYDTMFEVSLGTNIAEIYKGFHSYSPDRTYYNRDSDSNIRIYTYSNIIGLIKGVNYTPLTRYTNSIIVSGYIPKGGAYALNEYGEYVSDCIVLNKIENA